MDPQQVTSPTHRWALARVIHTEEDWSAAAPWGMCILRGDQKRIRVAVLGFVDKKLVPRCDAEVPTVEEMPKRLEKLLVPFLPLSRFVLT